MYRRGHNNMALKKKKENSKLLYIFFFCWHFRAAHFPGYHYCGPGTDFEKRVSRGQLGVNKLDEACRDHDMVYSNSTDLELRIEADKRLEIRAWERATASDSGYMEKIAAWMVTNAMKVKRKWNNRQLRRQNHCREKRMNINIVVLINNEIKKLIAIKTRYLITACFLNNYYYSRTPLGGGVYLKRCSLPRSVFWKQIF